MEWLFCEREVSERPQHLLACLIDFIFLTVLVSHFDNLVAQQGQVQVFKSQLLESPGELPRR
eukprot:6180439-Amphidinium_carterae.1